MTDPLDLAQHLCGRAERALEDARPHAAIELAESARSLVGASADPLAGGIYVRASVAAAAGAALIDDLHRALIIATTAVLWAEHCDASPEACLAARLAHAEVLEMRGHYLEAALAFRTLAQYYADQDWGANLAMRSANHLLSIGVHNADPDTAEYGIRIGQAVRSRVKDADEESAWLQWFGLYLSRRGRYDDAADCLHESFSLRADTPRRRITKLFLDAELAFLESHDFGVTTLAHAVTTARDAGLNRHARAAAHHMRRFTE